MTLALIVMLVFGIVLLAAFVSAAMFMAAPKNWRVISIDAVTGAEKPVGGVFPTEDVAQFAARRRMSELAQQRAKQPANAPAQDQIWVVRPNGERYRMDGG